MISVQYLEQQRTGAATDYLFSLLQQKSALQRPGADKRAPKAIAVIVSRNAEIALRGLTPEDYKAVQLSIHRLRVAPPAIVKEVKVQPSLNSTVAYVRHVADLTLLLSLVNNEIVVEDIFPRSRLPQILRGIT